MYTLMVTLLLLTSGYTQAMFQVTNEEYERQNCRFREKIGSFISSGDIGALASWLDDSWLATRYHLILKNIRDNDLKKLHEARSKSQRLVSSYVHLLEVARTQHGEPSKQHYALLIQEAINELIQKSIENAHQNPYPKPSHAMNFDLRNVLALVGDKYIKQERDRKIDEDHRKHFIGNVESYVIEGNIGALAELLDQPYITQSCIKRLHKFNPTYAHLRRERAIRRKFKQAQALKKGAARGLQRRFSDEGIEELITKNNVVQGMIDLLLTEKRKNIKRRSCTIFDLAVAGVLDHQGDPYLYEEMRKLYPQLPPSQSDFQRPNYISHRKPEQQVP